VRAKRMGGFCDVSHFSIPILPLYCRRHLKLNERFKTYPPLKISMSETGAAYGVAAETTIHNFLY